MTKATLFTLLVLGLCFGRSEAQPTYEVRPVSGPLSVDGALIEPAWETAKKMSFVDNRTGAARGPETWAKIIYDDTYLYFAFYCADDNIWSTYTQRDQHLWTEEVVEVFIQADLRHPSYLELEVNPLGTMLDIFLIDTRKPLKYESWNSSRLLWAVQVDGTVDGRPGDKAWTCEIALPHEDVVTAPNNPPKQGDRWQLNLYRVENRPNRAGLAWSPTLKPDFHVPAQFGEIVFAPE
jgi:hypothetical protein